MDKEETAQPNSTTGSIQSNWMKNKSLYWRFKLLRRKRFLWHRYNLESCQAIRYLAYSGKIEEPLSKRYFSNDLCKRSLCLLWTPSSKAKYTPEVTPDWLSGRNMEHWECLGWGILPFFQALQKHRERFDFFLSSPFYSLCREKYLAEKAMKSSYLLHKDSQLRWK